MKPLDSARCGPVVARACAGIAALALLALAGPVPAADSAPIVQPQVPASNEASRPSTVEGKPSDATVIVYNRPIVEYRGTFLHLAPAERARRTKRALDDLLARGGPGKVEIQASAQGYMVMLDGTFALIVTPEDADVLAGETAEGKANKAARALEEVFALNREANDRSARIRALLLAVTATVLLAAVWWLMWRTWNWLVPRFVAQIRAHVARHRDAGGRMFAGAVEEFLIRIVQFKLIYRLLLLMLIVQWLSFVLGQFPYTRYWGESMNGFVLGILSNIGSSFLDALPDLLVSIVIFLLAWLAHRAVKLFFHGVETRQIALSWLEPETALATRRLVSVGLWVFALVMAYPYLPGSSSAAFKGLSVLLGLMISLGSSNIVGQAASGLILMYTRTLKVGQYVRIADVEGTVVQLGMFATHISTGLDADVTLPNSLVLSNVTRNYSRVDGPGFVINTEVTIGYDAPWRQVEAMLLEAAQRTQGIGPEPKPQVFQIKLTDFYPEYRLVCRGLVRDPRARAELLNALHGNIQDVFNEHGVQIMSPHYYTDPSKPKLVPKQDWYASPARPPER